LATRSATLFRISATEMSTPESWTAELAVVKVRVKPTVFSDLR
jgi:hypothetical protein